MCTFIGIEDLAANALIELYDHNNCKKIKFSTLVDYGIEIVKLLNTQGEEAVLLVSRNDTNAMLRNYSDLFKIEKKETEEFIVLENNISVDDFRYKFRSYMSLELLRAFLNENSLKVLGIEAA